MGDIGKIFIILGSIMIILGIVLNITDKVPLLGKLPGDIIIKQEGFTLYIPLATSIILSIVLSVLFKIFNK